MSLACIIYIDIGKNENEKNRNLDTVILGESSGSALNKTCIHPGDVRLEAVEEGEEGVHEPIGVSMGIETKLAGNTIWGTEWSPL